jgi:hypothetical protein
MPPAVAKGEGLTDVLKYPVTSAQIASFHSIPEAAPFDSRHPVTAMLN